MSSKKGKVERHKEATLRNNQDKKFKQLATEIQTPLNNEELKISESIEKSQEASEAGCSVPEKMKQMSIESSNYTMDSQQDSNIQSSSESNERDKSLGTSNVKYLVDKYKTFDSKKTRKKVRKEVIQIMRQFKYSVIDMKLGEFAKKYSSSAPYHLFFTTVVNSKETYNQQFSVTFPEILDCSLGEIVDSLHLNFTVDVVWLCLQYLLAGQRINMTILYDNLVYNEILADTIIMIKVNKQREFNCHHTKIMILRYKDDGIRVIISTANLYSDDWENRTQGLWISPHLPQLPKSASPSDGESPTGFKKDLERYLYKYEEPALKQWISAIHKADFSDVNVFFIASVPGIHRYNEIDFWGFRKLAHVLSHHVTLPPNASQWPIVAQSSTIGSIGTSFENWLSKDIIRCMSKETSMDSKNCPPFQFIYPSIQNYEQSFDRQNLFCGMHYKEKKHSKQQWLDAYLYKWKAERTGRDRAMPFIKSYTRISPDLKSIPWFVLTSANLSKSAWGCQQWNYHIANYEAGVVFIPKLITGSKTFPTTDDKEPTVPVFPIPYDLPLCRYESGDDPFVIEYFNSL